MFKKLRIETGMRPGAFCGIAGVSYPVLYKIEAGKTGVSLESKVKVITALNLLLGTRYTLEDFIEAQEAK